MIALRQGLLTMSEFSKQMATLEGVTRASTEQLAAFETTARALGANTVFTASQAAEGMIFLARAGFDAGEVVKAIGPTLQLATAAMIDLGLASDIVANTINQFALSAGDANRVADVMVDITNRTNTNVQQLGEAFEYVGPAAAVAGKSLEETSAVLGVLADRGIKASIAGTNLRGIFAQLSGPLDRQTKALAQLGVSLDEVDPALNSVADIFDTLRSAGLDASLAVELFGRRNFNAAVVLADATEEIRANEQALLDAAGAAEFNADKIDNSLFGAFKRLASASQEALLAVADRGAESALADLSNTAADLIKNLFNVSGASEDTSAGIGLLSTGIRTLTGLATAYIAVNIGAAVFRQALALRAAAAAAGSYQLALSSMLGVQGVLTLGLGAAAVLILEIADSMQNAEVRAANFRAEIEKLSQATIDLSSESSQIERTYDRLSTATAGFFPRDLERQFTILGRQLTEVRENIVAAADIDPVDIPLRIDRNALDGTYNDATVAVESLRKIFDDAGSGLLDSFLKEFAGSAENAVINGPIGTAIEARRNRLEELLGGGFFAKNIRYSDEIKRVQGQIADLEQNGERLLGFDEQTLRRRGLNDLLGARDFDVSNIPAEDAIRLIDQLVAGLDSRAKDATESLNELYAAEQAAAVQEIFAQFRSDLEDERQQLTLSSEDYAVYITRKKALAVAEKEGVIVKEDQIAALSEEVRSVETLRASVEAEEEAKKAALQTERERQQAVENSRNSLESYLQSMEEQNALLQVEGVERAVLSATYRVLREERNLDAEEIAKYIQRATELAQANQGLLDAAEAAKDAERERQELIRAAEREESKRLRDIERASEAMVEQNKAIALEIDLLGQSNEAKRIAKESAEFYANALLGYNGNADVANSLTADFKNRLLELEDATRIADLYDDIGSAFSDSFTEIVTGAESVEEAMESMVKNIYKILFQELVARQIASFFSGLLGNIFGFGVGGGGLPGAVPNPQALQAMGGAWVGGTKRFMQGGVVDQPTVFPMMNGFGMMSEFGQNEAIMPLARTSTGELGVRGGGGGQTINNYFNIQTPNADSFRASKAQISRDISRSMSRS